MSILTYGFIPSWVSHSELKGCNWLLRQEQRPESSLLNHLLLVHGSHTQSRKQSSIFLLKIKTSASKATVNRSIKKTDTPKTSYTKIAKKHKILDWAVEVTMISIQELEAGIYQDNTLNI